MNQNWYALYTRPRWEKKVSDLLKRRDFDCYCPLNKVVKQWSDRKKIIQEPLFKSYVFVKSTLPQLSEIRKVDGIINLVYWLGKPAVIKETEIETIKDFLCDYTNVRLERVPINMYDLVRIVSGPLRELEGTVVGVQNRTIKLILPSMGYMMSAEVAATSVKVITRNESIQPINIPSTSFQYSY